MTIGPASIEDDAFFVVGPGNSTNAMAPGAVSPTPSPAPETSPSPSPSPSPPLSSASIAPFSSIFATLYLAAAAAAAVGAAGLGAF